MTQKIGQATPVWTGSIVWAVLAGGALALLMTPPSVPAHARTTIS